MTAGATATVETPRREAPAPLQGSPVQALAGSTLLLDAFHAFYAEVVRQRQLVTLAHGGLAPGIETVRQRLVDFLETQAVSLGRKLTKHELRAYDDAQYVMAAMADELLLQAEWDGRYAWAERPLEAHIFHTYVSGERIFRKLDDVLSGHDAAPSALLLVYLAALALGFQGKYRALGLRDKPERYRQDLALHLQRVDPTLATGLTELCPQAHAHTLGGSSRSRLPSLRAGVVPLAVVAGLLALAAQGVWLYRVDRVVEELDRIEGAP
ncbi:DotU family type IV/VI secretion system protein [Sorangium sp. KYC3313]|uniref:DotU family type IV/VI secretion system protein n=1 Tax=Sorangium TaxID=39643 RepID=UPI000320F30D|nr:DotU family type IV/VI secretion system protein [Sorangium cellulosum]